MIQSGSLLDPWSNHPVGLKGRLMFWILLIAYTCPVFTPYHHTNTSALSFRHCILWTPEELETLVLPGLTQDASKLAHRLMRLLHKPRLPTHQPSIRMVYLNMAIKDSHKCMPLFQDLRTYRRPQPRIHHRNIPPDLSRISN